MSSATLTIPRREIAAFCQRYPIRRLALFGSALGEDFGPESDVDLLVEFLPGARISFFEMVTMEMELADLLGRKVDLRTPQELSRYFRQAVLDRAEVLYERAATCARRRTQALRRLRPAGWRADGEDSGPSRRP